MPDLVTTTLADRPELEAVMWAMPDRWPEFMGHDEIAAALFSQVSSTFPHLCMVATEGDEVVARAFAAPFILHTDRRGTLPDGGWDRVLTWAFRDHRNNTKPDTVTALEIAVRPDRLGAGMSHSMLGALRAAAAAAGFGELVAPVRPNGKHAEPHTPMTDYVARTRDDGLPVDAWLRTHVRAGATVDSVAPRSMVIAGSLAEWRAWTGLPFDETGEVTVPEALVPVRCQVEHDYAVYVEPNVWVRHRLSA
ncbi:N-acetyltransferase [Actinopolymorpha rutila]|uniref:GNAT superfamily N-acetyltransferase n=1 Tax=Actinopolymorpha rutila TaxID=446787 RepID=A0A852ZKN7_9ACTN|nr:N-acetyltransferase [Actinopolymorpha rutila]NYH92172.1 GNAT superfamily N-acetyltransferase [Actinopolymorpha rutila]